MIFHVSYMVHDIWCMNHGIWQMICDLSVKSYAMWYMLYDII